MTLNAPVSSSVNQTLTLKGTAYRTSYSITESINLINRASNVAFIGSVFFSAGREMFLYSEQMSRYTSDRLIDRITGWGANQQSSFLLEVAVTRFVMNFVCIGSVYLGVRAINYLAVKLNDFVYPKKFC